MEAADRVDLVTEELDAHRMRFGGNKHVDDAATHRELATVHHQIDARIGIADEALHGIFKGDFLTLRENERLHVTYASHHRLDERTHRHDQNAYRAEHLAVGLRVAQPVERLHAVRHRVGAWAKPLVGQRLPCHQLCHLIRIAVIPRSQIADEILRLATGGDDDDHWLTVRTGGGQCWTNAVGSSDEDARVGVLARIHMAFHQTGECLILQKTLPEGEERTVHQLVVGLLRRSVRIAVPCLVIGH